MTETAKAAPGRDTSRDGLRNKLEEFVLTGFKPFWRFINGNPSLSRIVNRLIVNNAVLKAPARPLALSTMAPYSSWASLTDRTWFARYLPPADQSSRPPIDSVAALFALRPEGPRLSTRSTLLFPYFAEWFTDGFLMTDAADRRRTTTSHQIDLGQLYGASAAVTDALRLHSQMPGQKGRLKSDITPTGEWAPRLYDSAGQKAAEFAALPDPIHLPPGWPPAKLATIFAFGGERANSTAYTAATNTLFLREHNRLAGMLESANSGWDDERVFQTARNIGIVQLIKIVVEEYINHISPYWFQLLADPAPCYKAIWNRENWIPVEFNLLYRWHSLVPETAIWNDAEIAMADICFDNSAPLRDGLAAALNSASRSKAWQLGLFNTSAMLAAVERASIAQGRTNQLASYNDYRAIMRYPRVTRFEQISSDPAIIVRLREVYQHVDNIEFYAGLFAEDLPDRSAVPRLIGRMVAVDAFSHALTNPLLSPHVYNETTFTAAGMAAIGATSRLQDLAARNNASGAGGPVTMEQTV
jgi:prostaglandin-endoperoxide synthase 2